MTGTQATKHQEFRIGRDHCKRLLTKGLQLTEEMVLKLGIKGNGISRKKRGCLTKDNSLKELPKLYTTLWPK